MSPSLALDAMNFLFGEYRQQAMSPYNKIGELLLILLEDDM